MQSVVTAKGAPASDIGPKAGGPRAGGTGSFAQSVVAA